MHGFLSPGKGWPFPLTPEYSGISKEQRIPDRSQTAHRKPPVKCFLITEESRGTRAAALPSDLHKSAPDLTGAAGTQGCLVSRALGPLGTAGSGCHPYRRDTGRNSGRQELSWRENPITVILPPAYFKPQAEIQGRESHVGLPGGNLTA